MNAILAIIATMRVQGHSEADILAVVEAVATASDPMRTKRQERNRRYYENHKEELQAKASEKRLIKTSEQDAKEGSFPPYDINNSTPPISEKNTHNRARETFDRFFEIFPKRINRKDAFVRWNTALKAGVDPERIIAAAIRYAEYMKFTEPQFIKAPDAWLNGAKYDDELPAEPQKQPARAGTRSSTNGVVEMLNELNGVGNVEPDHERPAKDITPASASEPRGCEPPARLFEPSRKPSWGETLDLRPTSSDLRGSPAAYSAARRTG